MDSVIEAAKQEEAAEAKASGAHALDADAKASTLLPELVDLKSLHEKPKVGREAVRAATCVPARI